MWCVIWSYFGCATIRRRCLLSRRRIPAATRPAMPARRIPSCVTLANCSNSYFTLHCELLPHCVFLTNLESFETGHQTTQCGAAPCIPIRWTGPIICTRAKSYEDWLWTSTRDWFLAETDIAFYKKICKRWFNTRVIRVYRPSLLSLFAHLNACDVTHTRVAHRCLIPCLRRTRGRSLASVASRAKVGYHTLVC